MIVDGAAVTVIVVDSKWISVIVNVWSSTTDVEVIEARELVGVRLGGSTRGT